jgi:N6-L-threonylcarbamoyladenine synthase
MTALGGNAEAVNFQRGEAGPEGLQISFSGLKTAVLNDLRRRGFVMQAQANSGRILATPGAPIDKGETRTLSLPMPLSDIAASFQEAAVDILVRATLASTRRARCKSVALCGGVAANKRLRESMAAACKAQKNTRFTAAPIALCTDNAEMVAGLGFHKAATGQYAGLDADVMPNKQERRARAAG